MVGREVELEQLSRILARARAGHGGLVLLAGEAGVGKTSLADAAVAAARLASLRGVAAEHGGSPYGPIAEVLRQHLRRDPAGLATTGPLVSHLAVLLPELGSVPAHTNRETLSEAVRDALGHVAAREPTVVLLDDLQWADSATLELLPVVAAAAEEWPLAVLGVYRSDEIPRGHSLRRLRTELRRAGRLSELTVEPVDAAATALIAGRVLGSEPGPALQAALFDRTQGVPFFVEELTEALRVAGRLVPGPGGLELEEGSSVPIPETLRDALRIRVDGLSVEGGATLEAAAVIGLEVELDLLSELGHDAGLAEVVDRGLLRESDAGLAVFRHDLVRETIYASTHWPRRRSLHRELAGILEARRAEPWTVADHWLAAGERVRALPLLVAAASRSCAVHAYRDAAAAGRKALEIWPEGVDEPGRLQVLEELGHCAQLCGELSEAARALEEVAASLEPGDAGRVADVKQRLAVVYELEGAPERATALRIEVADALEAAGRDADVATELLLAADGLWDEARLLQALDRAIAAARRAGSTELEAQCLSQRGFYTARTGRRDEGLEMMQRALSLALEHEHVEVAVNAYWTLGAAANDWAEYPLARTAFDDMLRYCEANDLVEMQGVCLGCLAIVLANAGEWHRAEAVALDLLEQAVPSAGIEAHARVALGLIAVCRGASRDGRRHLARAWDLANAAGMEASEHDCDVFLALADELDGKPSPRWSTVVAHPAVWLAPGRPRGLRLAATCAARRQDGALVFACANAASVWASRFASDDALAALAHVLGEVALFDGDAALAVDQFTRALERLAKVDTPFEHALTQSRFGVALLAAGERALGVEQLTSAHTTFRRLGARPFARRAAADLQALGERVDQRLGRRAAHDLEHGGLTRRELEILRLVAVGRTNREIAQQLFLSPRTVDMHVRNLLAKLGCRTRTEAASRAHALGLLEPTPSG